MDKPRILLSASKKMQYYIDAVNGTGGIADAKYLPEADADYDGLILCGGGDIHPSYFHEAMDGSVNIDRERDAAEFAVMRAFVEAGKPVLGICRGCQLINIFFGGSLHQDLRNAKEHSSFSDFDLVHPVCAEKGSVMETLYGMEFAVNSYHHQAVKELGEGLKVSMRSMVDNVIEGITHQSLPVFGVQWHPERMSFTKRRTDTVDGAAIFSYFMELCRR